jgi:hypothetical protein
MNRKENFFSRAELMANQEHLNAVGDEVYADDYEALGEEMYADDDDDDDDDDYYAVGKKSRRKTSLPITIIATNTSSVAQAQFELFKASTTFRKANIALDGTVVLSSGIQGVTYEEIITALLSDAYEFGNLRITANYAPSDAVLNSAPDASIQYLNKTLEGRINSVPINPSVNSFQQVKNVRDVAVPILINNMASCITSIPGSTQIKYEFYTKESTNSGALLMKKATVKKKAPALNRVTTPKW